jgi:hypothetical protein
VYTSTPPGSVLKQFNAVENLYTACLLIPVLNFVRIRNVGSKRNPECVTALTNNEGRIPL